MKRRLMNFLLIGASLFSAVAQTDGKALEEVARSRSFAGTVRSQVYENPAARYFRQDYSLTAVSLSAEKTSAEETRFAPLGNGGYRFGFEASSFVRLGENGCIWGDASYSNGEKKDVVWNETSDFLLLYPYVMADSIGGNMRFEQYFLSGGYAAGKGRWHYGVSLRYRALAEYRTVDPRPNNVVADLLAQAAFGAEFGKYLLAVSLEAGKYKQTNELKYFDELGSSKEYHLTGLGTEFVRFSGASNTVFYKGRRFGGSVEWLPVGGKGVSASVRFSRFSFDKILSDLNKLALNHLFQNEAEGEIVWNGSRREQSDFGVKLAGRYAARYGTDNLFGDASGNVYPQIGSVRMFESEAAGGQVSGFYEQTVRGKFPLGIFPFAGWSSYRSSHAGSGNRLDSESLLIGTSLKAAYAGKRDLLELHVSACFRKNFSTALDLSSADVRSSSLAQMLKHTEQYLSGNEAVSGLTLRYDRGLPKGSKTLFVEMGWQHHTYLGGCRENQCFIKAGITL